MCVYGMRDDGDGDGGEWKKRWRKMEEGWRMREGIGG